jgi:hypothetical protein
MITRPPTRCRGMSILVLANPLGIYEVHDYYSNLSCQTCSVSVNKLYNVIIKMVKGGL